MSNQTEGPARQIRDRLPVRDAADYLGLSKSALDKFRGEGRGPRYLRLGNRIFYWKSDLDSYIEQGMVETSDSRAAA